MNDTELTNQLIEIRYCLEDLTGAVQKINETLRTIGINTEPKMLNIELYGEKFNTSVSQIVDEELLEK